MDNAPDWHAVEERLFEESKTAILQFATEHPDEIFSFFAYYTEPYYGNFLLFLETYANALKAAQENEQQAIARRKSMLRTEGMWISAKSFTTHPSVTYHAPSVGNLTSTYFANIQFDGWEEFAESEEYPKGQEWNDDYLEGNVRIVIWKVVERLIEEDIFEELRLASPFFIGYEVHDEEMVILRILHWLKQAS